MLPLLLLCALAARAATAAGVTRETVQRMVMVRTSGSDLAPAATGYLYHKSDDGESVVRMAHGEIERRLADAHPARAAPAAPAASAERSDEREPVDGAADFDYSKLFADFSAPRGSRDYDDYFKRIKDEFHSKYGDRRGSDDERSERPRYEKGEGESYRNAKFESYSFSDGDEKGAPAAAVGEQIRRGPASYEVYDNSESDLAHEYFPAGQHYYAEGGRSYGSEDAKADSVSAEGEASVERPAADASAVEVANSAAAAGPASTPADSAEGDAAPRTASGSYGYEIKH